jgi:hypothetical protein
VRAVGPLGVSSGPSAAEDSGSPRQARVAVGSARRSSEAYQLTSQLLIEAHRRQLVALGFRPRRKDKRNRSREAVQLGQGASVAHVEPSDHRT